MVAILVAVVAIAALVATVRPAAASARCPALHIVVEAPRPEAALGATLAIADLRAVAPELEVVVGDARPEHAPAILIEWSAAEALDRTRSRIGHADLGADDDAPTVITMLAEAELPAAGPKSWQAAVLHELGHAVGLSHSTTPGSVMYPTLEHLGPAWSPGQRSLLRELGRAPHCGRVGSPRTEG
jgi:hypothetical protein